MLAARLNITSVPGNEVAPVPPRRQTPAPFSGIADRIAVNSIHGSITS